MTTPDSAPTNPPGETPEQFTAAVHRILASPQFERAHRLSELLNYLLRRTLDGDAQALKESAIGHAVFGRRSDYNAADDNIVRASVRQLRLRLDEYYHGEGAAEAWRVNIPKGSYALRLEAQPNSAANRTVSPPSPAHARPWRPFAVGLVSGLALAGLAALLWFRSGAPAPAAPSLLGLLTPAPGQKLMVIGPDSGVQHYRNFTRSTITLDEFLNRRFFDPEELARKAPKLPHEVTDLFRGGSVELFVAALLPAFAQVIPPEDLVMPLPSSVKVADFARDNSLLISGPLGNPWVQLFDQELNFQVVSESSDQRLAYILNRQPKPGESAVYKNFVDASRAVVCYSRLAFLPGRSARTRVLLAGGPHSASTQASCLFLTRADFLTSLQARLPHTANGRLPYFEAVVEARAVASDPWAARIVAIRVVDSPVSPSSL